MQTQQFIMLPDKGGDDNNELRTTCVYYATGKGDGPMNSLHGFCQNLWFTKKFVLGRHVELALTLILAVLPRFFTRGGLNVLPKSAKFTANALQKGYEGICRTSTRRPHGP